MTRERYYYTEFGMLSCDEYHSALGRWPACVACGWSDPVEIAAGALSSDGLCGECEWTRDHPVPPECPCTEDETCEGCARERMAEERFEREREGA